MTGEGAQSGRAVGIIPARMASERFPGKVLACETGRPLIQHVYEAARRATSIERLIVATDAEVVAEAVRAFGGEAVMTREDHPNGTSRLAEAADALGLSGEAIVVNIQGDEPEIEPSAVDAAVAAREQSGCPMATVASPFAEGEDPADPNIVKVVMRRDGRALYFSRALIPHRRGGGDAKGGGDGGAGVPLRHVGLYAYHASFLRAYVELPVTPLEQAERLEQLRALEHGHEIAVSVVSVRSQGIDTPEQYAAFVARWRAQGDG